LPHQEPHTISSAILLTADCEQIVLSFGIWHLPSYHALDRLSIGCDPSVSKRVKRYINFKNIRWGWIRGLAWGDAASLSNVVGHPRTIWTCTTTAVRALRDRCSVGTTKTTVWADVASSQRPCLLTCCRSLLGRGMILQYRPDQCQEVSLMNCQTNLCTSPLY
jgi:hypothetical protein